MKEAAITERDRNTERRRDGVKRGAAGRAVKLLMNDAGLGEC